MPYLADSINKDGLRGSPLPACPAPVATRIWTTKFQRASSCPAPPGHNHLFCEEAEDTAVVEDANGRKVVTLREQPEGEVPPPPKAPEEFRRPPKESRFKDFSIKEAKSFDHMMDHSNNHHQYSQCLCILAQPQFQSSAYTAGLVHNLHRCYSRLHTPRTLCIECTAVVL